MKKNLIRLTESDLRNIIKSSVNKLLKEGFEDGDFYYQDGHPYGWSDKYLNDDYDVCEVDSHYIAKLEDYANGIMDIANALDCDIDLLVQSKRLVDEFIEKNKN